jgi:hypothetical protein
MPYNNSTKGDEIKTAYTTSISNYIMDGRRKNYIKSVRTHLI